MNKFCKLSVSLLVAGSFLISLAQSQEAPRTMTKVTTKIVEPKPEPGSFSAQAKTVWRAGKKYARTAEAPDSQNHIHGLAIINEPDAWMINLFDKSARHLVDPGPSFNVHLPVLIPVCVSKTGRCTLKDGPGLTKCLADLSKRFMIQASGSLMMARPCRWFCASGASAVPV